MATDQDILHSGSYVSSSKVRVTGQETNVTGNACTSSAKKRHGRLRTMNRPKQQAHIFPASVELLV